MKLEFQHLSAAYRRRTILEDICFTAESGAITAVIGRNGAGKSTLINCLTGEKQDYRGTILADGQDVRHLSIGQRSLRMACLAQNLPRPHVTVAELAAFGRTPYTPLTGTLSKEDRQAVDRAISAVGLDAFREAFVDQLSGGERKKAFFALTLAQDTPLVILDEPTAHLDMVSRFEFLELISKMRAETGKTFLVVMDELPEVLRFADKIVAIHENTAVFVGTPEECLKSDVPQRCFHIQITGSRESGYSVLPIK